MRARIALLTSVALAACETGGEATSPPVVVPSTAVVRAPEPAEGAARVLLDAPFEPHTLEGRAGGPIAASTRRSECAGHVSEAPSHVIELAEASALALRVTSEDDTVLVVQTPEGAWLCNDDHEGLDPAIAGTFARGEARVWVGTWDAERAGAPYALSIASGDDAALPRGEPTIDRLNAVCSENWCREGRAYRFTSVSCDGASDCVVRFERDGSAGEVTTLGARASWAGEGLDERFVDALGNALSAQ